MPTYKEQRDKIIEAYFKDEIKPFDAKFCFCGTLNNNNSAWVRRRFHYSLDEFYEMEKALYSGLKSVGLKIIGRLSNRESINDIQNWQNCDIHPNYENALFGGMSAALDVLKEIHRNRGENVDEETTPFIKRNKVPETTKQLDS